MGRVMLGTVGLDGTEPGNDVVGTFPKVPRVPVVPAVPVVDVPLVLPDDELPADDEPFCPNAGEMQNTKTKTAAAATVRPRPQLLLLMEPRLLWFEYLINYLFESFCRKPLMIRSMKVPNG